ncbi:ArsR/SmtB family transcription factor [Rhodoferax sp.]|uniref:ArsR/SmtB family transcription factor n=1 Tax=Rhodoferax sp. TaxID=50421 RepID=UPI00374CA4E1
MLAELAPTADTQLSRVAAAIAEPARARMLCCLMDGHARTSTELSVVAEVSPSTASTHLGKLKDLHLVALVSQGKHRYYRLASGDVATALEALLVLAGTPRSVFVPATPGKLRHARTCYDHIAGALGVALGDRILAHGWLQPDAADPSAYALSANGEQMFQSLGIDVAGTRQLRRRFACACLDWSERRPHIGGALGAALLQLSLRRGWVLQDLDSRALSTTALGQRELQATFDLAPNAHG